MAKRKGERLHIGRDEEGRYVFLAGAHPFYCKKEGWWYASKADWLIGEEGSRVSLCAKQFEQACPHLKLKPGEIVEIEVTKKE